MIRNLANERVCVREKKNEKKMPAGPIDAVFKYL